MREIVKKIVSINTPVLAVIGFFGLAIWGIAFSPSAHALETWRQVFAHQNFTSQRATMRQEQQH